MRMLLWYVERFHYEPAIKNIEQAETVNEGREFKNVILAFIHGEAKDEENTSGVETKLVKNIKWLGGKLGCKNTVLHSFAHLGESKCSPTFLKDMFDRAELRLKNAGYKTSQTPYGYFLDIDLNAPGKSLARVYKEF